MVAIQACITACGSLQVCKAAYIALHVHRDAALDLEAQPATLQRPVHLDHPSGRRHTQTELQADEGRQVLQRRDLCLQGLPRTWQSTQGPCRGKGKKVKR